MDCADIEIITRAADFAAKRHATQRRKDDGATPYINHLIEVAHLLASAGCDANLVAAGYLHDTTEDQRVSNQELEACFGPDIAALVAFATDDKQLAKGIRKNLQVEHAAKASSRQANLKIADKISNLRAIRDTPPAGWSSARREKYIAWAHQVVSQLPAVEPALRAAYDDIRAQLLRQYPNAEFADPKYPDDGKVG